jgi:hypothetical protein
MVESQSGKGPFAVCELDEGISLSSLREEFCGAPFRWGSPSGREAPLLIDEMVQSITHTEISSFLCIWIRDHLRRIVPGMNPADPHVEVRPKGMLKNPVAIYLKGHHVKVLS